MSRKKSIDVNLPEVPQIPHYSDFVPSPKRFSSKGDESVFCTLYGYKDREASFFKALDENIKMFDESKIGSGDITQSAAEMSTETMGSKSVCEEECREYIMPLMNRTQGSITALLATKDSLDQLDSLHRIIQQLLTVQGQNYQMRKRLRTVKTLHVLKEMEIRMNSDPEKFLKNCMEDGSDIEIDGEFEQNIADLEAVLAASKSASNKRNNSKKQRSKSIISEDIGMSPKENYRNYPLRRQSAISDFKPKVSKWKAVKAAFKWEKANTLNPLNESKSSDSILSPSLNENTKYFLRVPNTAMACSSGDSLFSASSGRNLNFATSGTVSGQSSDENDETPKSKNYIRAPLFHDEERRSHSLDGDLTYGSHSLQHSPSEKNKNSKSAWSKVKGIVINRSSRKSLKSTGSVNSRDVSPIDLFNDVPRDRSEDSISSPNQPSSPCNLGLPEVDLCPTSDESEYRNDGRKVLKQVKRNSKKGRLIPEIESLPEGVVLLETKKLPSPLILKRDFSESDGLETTSSLSKLFHRKYSATISDPNSPLQAQEFFSENDFSSGADNSEPLSPLRRGCSNNSSRSSRQHDEILKNYEELQKKISQEFENKQQEWSRKLRPLVLQLNNSMPPFLKEDSSLPTTPKSAIENLLLNEENLSADFKRKLEEWRIKKSQQSMKESSKKPQQSPDWKAWMTGQMKFENQGLIALPDAKSLPENFQKKLNEWKQMKAEGKTPPYNTQPSVQEKLRRQFSKSDGPLKKSKTIDENTHEFSKLKSMNPAREEIVVKTSEGLIKFKGISRSFTRKLYEWEKAKGIAPESSAFEFLHPKYQAFVDNQVNHNDEDNASGMKRALSVDSIKPLSSTQISHQPSSLSLNDADNLKETENKKVSSDIQIYRGTAERRKFETDISADEPEAVIVEVEDDGLEVIPLCSETTPLQIQIPIFKFDFVNKDSKGFDMKMDVDKTLKNIRNSISDIDTCLPKLNFDTHVSHDNLREFINDLKDVQQLLNHLKETVKNDEVYHSIKIADEILKMAEASSSSPRSSSSQCFQEKYNELKSSVQSFFAIASNAEKFQATSSIENSDDKAMATVKITPSFICNTFSIKVDEPTSKPQQQQQPKVSSGSEKPELSTEDMKSDEKYLKKVVRNTSNTSKRKIRLRRVGSRQNSKTESDSDEEFAQNSETQRKAKRKTSRCKKALESDKSFDSYQGEEEVIYVFKIKPGETNEIIVKSSEQAAPEVQQDDSILISPTENCVELIDAHDYCQNSFTNPIVKTKRKMFTPIDEGMSNEACISHEVESSSSSEKMSDKQVTSSQVHVGESPSTIKDENSIFTLKSQAPEKPPRKCGDTLVKQGSIKDLSPSIRRMIDIYNFNLEDKSMGCKSGSTSPLWLSPVLNRRVRKQSAEYQEKITKSGSSQEMSMKDAQTDDEQATICDISIEESKFEAQIEDPVVVKEAFQISTGAIPKRPKFLVEVTIDSNEVVRRRDDPEKPRTPLSERALKIRQAKEAFFKAPVPSTASPGDHENYRLSQISIGSFSTISNSVENISLSTSAMLTNSDNTENILVDNASIKTTSITQITGNSEDGQDSSKSSMFGLSTIATKLRKVKLKKGTKEAKKMNTIPVLCRQSLNVDLFKTLESPTQSSSKPEKTQSAFRFKKNKNSNVKKSKSLGLL